MWYVASGGLIRMTFLDLVVGGFKKKTINVIGIKARWCKLLGFAGFQEEGDQSKLIRARVTSMIDRKLSHLNMELFTPILMDM